MHTDCVQPFLFEHLDIRGALTSLDQTWTGLTRDRGYPVEVAAVLGEMSAVTALIAANLKQAGRLTFQLRGDGAVNLLVLDCDEQLRMRGMARWQAEQLQPASGTALLGGGRLVLTLDSEGMRQPWQSLVSIDGDSIAEVFEHYLTRSEQTPTRLRLAADSHRATGLLLQKLPLADERDADGWNRVQHLLVTLSPAEMLSLPPIELLRRLFPEETLRVFEPRPVCHHCPDDPQKIHAMLRALGRDECEAILAEKGELHVRDDLCNRDYHLGAADMATLFDAPSTTFH